VNLGWKLAAVVHGRTPESLLDTYGAERRPVAERVVHNTRAQVAISRPGPHVDAMRDVLAGLMVTDDVRHPLAGMITALDIHYDLGTGHPVLGRRMPDLPLKTGDGDTRVLELLRGGRPVVLDLGAGLPDVSGVDVVRARCDLAEWDLPVLGSVPAVDAVLVRPDGYVAWTSAGPGTLAAALWTWFGIDTRG
jgi:hypothetical protein